MENKKINRRTLISIILIIIIVASVEIALFFIFNNKEEEKKEEPKKNKTEIKEEFSYTPPLYKVCDSDSCLHVMGTIHLGNSKITNLSKKALDVYDNSDTLVVELDVTEATIDTSKYVNSEDKTVEEVAPSELIEKLKKFGEKNPLFAYDTIKDYTPAYMTSYISTMLYMNGGYIQPGVDVFLLNKAHEDNKPIIALETIEEQEKLLYGWNFSQEFTLKQLETSIDNYDLEKKILKSLFDSYMNGDIEALAKAFSDDLTANDNDTSEYDNYINGMYTSRNNMMTNKVKEFLANNQNVLVAVGAAHVVMDDGIIDQLSKDYKVERIK